MTILKQSISGGPRPSTGSAIAQRPTDEQDLYLLNLNQSVEGLLAFTLLQPSDYPLRLLKGNGKEFRLIYVTMGEI